MIPYPTFASAIDWEALSPELFNLITRHTGPRTAGMLFSNRLRVAKAAEAAILAEVEAIDRERAERAATL